MAPPHHAPTRGGHRPPPDPVPLRPEQELLLEAASDGDLVLFKRLAKMLDGGRGRITEAVEAVVECTAGPLHFAAGHGELAMCRYLVEELRVDVNAIHDYGESPLAYAINGGHIATVRYLLNHGADPDKADDKGFTSLHIASEEAVLDWSVNGIIHHAKSLPPQKVYESGIEKDVARLKLQASKAIEREDYLTAIELYTKAMALDNDDATIFSNRSLCFLKMGEGEKAFADAYTCKMRRPDWPKAYYRQGAALMLLKDYAKACDTLFDGFKMDPGNAEIETALRDAMDSLRISHGVKKI